MNTSMDRRLLAEGLPIPTARYCDQPYLLKMDDDAWLCCITIGVGEEGQPGQTVITLRSADQGKTWSQPVYVEPPDGPEASYAVLLKVPSGRVYIFYNHNSENVREIPAETSEWFRRGICTRVDSLGSYVFKYSDDYGKSWSLDRYPIDVREMEIDRKNPFGSPDGSRSTTICYFWNVGKPFISGGSVFASLHKVGGIGEGFFTSSEGVLLRSGNLLSELDPNKILWETLPEGDHGLQTPPGGGPIAEEQSYVVLSDGSFFCVYRTIAGYPACAYSRDEARTWTQPDWMRFDPQPLTQDGKKLKHPRAANFVWKCNNGNYLYWFHNHGGRFIGEHPRRRTISYNDRNPAWMCGGIEVDTVEGKVIRWSQPEIVLYDDDPFVRTSYPDLIEDGRIYYLTETQKNIARVHKLDQDLLAGLWGQFAKPIDIHKQAVLAVSKSIPKGVQFRMPELPEFTRRDSERPDFGSVNLRKGFSIELVVTLENLTSGQQVLDNRTEEGRGFAVLTTPKGTLEVVLNDGKSENHWDCDPGVLLEGKRHHITVIVDGGPRIITWVVDGVLCDGGDFRQFGWGRFNPNLVGVKGAEEVRVGVGLDGLWIYSHALRISEVVGNFHYLTNS